MDEEQDSDLLWALEQLDDAAWAETLLPLLKANKCAGAFALACEQLRRLCHYNQTHLNLTRTSCSHLLDYETCDFDPDGLIDRFPACSSVAYRVHFPGEYDDDDRYDDGPKMELRDLLPMLARLPNLTSLQLDINSRAAYVSEPLVPYLQQLRLQLPQLRSLQLSLVGDWAGDSQQAWAALGAATQLTGLVVAFSRDGTYDWLEFEDDEEEAENGISLQHLSALQPLSPRLQHLEVNSFGAAGASLQDCSFLGSFSSLTSLRLPLGSKRAGLPAISSCTALRELWFDFWPTQDQQEETTSWPRLDAAECAALAQLTQLTLLDIPPSSDEPAMLSALQCLSRLAVLELLHVSSSHLPALATLSQLTQLRSTWVDESTEQDSPGATATAAAAAAACPSVVDVRVSGPFPLAAFPSVTSLSVHQPWQPSRLVALSQQLTKLEALSIHKISANSTFHSLDPDAPVAECVDAVRSLGQLPHLTRLQFAVSNDGEAAALAVACTQLKALCLHVPHDGQLVHKGWPYSWRVTAKGLSSLSSLSQLRSLSVVGYGLRLSQPQVTLVLTSLSALRELQELHVSTAKRRRTAVWEAAAAAAVESGLVLPAVCEFTVSEPDCGCEGCWFMVMASDCDSE